MKTFGYLAMAYLVCVGMAYGQQEITVEFQTGVNGYSGVRDLQVRSGAPDENTEGRTEWEWDGEDGGVNYGLLWFQGIVGDGPGQIPAGAELVNAELRTYVSNSGSGDQFSTIHNLLVEWDPETVTYNSLFGGAAPVPGEHYQAEPFSQNFHASAGQPWTADLTALVQEIVNGLANNGFVFVPDLLHTNGFGHVASEAATASTKLIVETPIGNFEFAPGANGYDGLQDAFISNDGEDFLANFGTGPALEIDQGAEESLLALIRFDGIFGDGPNQIPAGTEISGAVLQLSIINSGNTVLVNEILPHTETIGETVINTDFDETTVTFANFVSDGFLPQPGVEIAEEPVAELDASQAGLAEVDVTSSVQNWSNGAPNLGWVLEPTGSDGVDLSAKEASSNTPKLTVTYIGEETAVNEFMLY